MLCLIIYNVSINIECRKVRFLRPFIHSAEKFLLIDRDLTDCVLQNKYMIACHKHIISENSADFIRQEREP